MEYSVGLIFREKPIKLFKIGFWSKGFFITDFLALGSKNLEENSLAFKMKAHQLRNGLSNRKGYLFRRLSVLPKYSHHVDGFAQFSSEGLVISGKDSITSKPKGLGTKSFLLSERNDGGPFASFMFWGVEALPTTIPDENTQILSPQIQFQNDLLGDREPNALSIEFLYTLRTETSNPENSQFLNYNCDITGQRLVQILPTPDSFAGQICVSACVQHSGFTSQYGFSFSGGPGKSDKQNLSEQLVLIYPDPMKDKDIKSLDLTEIDKIQFGSRRDLGKSTVV